MNSAGVFVFSLLFLAFFVGFAEAQGNITAAAAEATRRCAALVTAGAQLDCQTVVSSWFQGYALGNYTGFFSLPNSSSWFSTLPSQSLFWSGTFTFTHQYFPNGTNLYFPGRITLETTVAGRIFDSLDSIYGLVYNSSTDKAPNNTAPFWGKASDLYAANATGDVWVALGGRSPFRNGSIFESVESYRLAAKLQSDPTTTITVIVFPFSINTGYTFSDGSCIGGVPTGSILYLLNRLTNNQPNNSRVSCRGLNARELALVQDYCTTNPSDNICSNATSPAPTTVAPATTTLPATTLPPTASPSTLPPTTQAPTTAAPTQPPATAAPTQPPATAAPTTQPPTQPPATAAPPAQPAPGGRTVININFAGLLRGR